MSKPINLNRESPRLTDMPGIKARGICQNCGRPDSPEKPVLPWCEHDHNDQPEYNFIFLCQRCADQLIEPHCRLYRQWGRHEPFPGAMPICDDCKFRQEIRCTNPKAQVNGGPGLKYDQPEPATAFVDGPKFRGRVRLYHSPVKACDGKEKRED